ncbi:MAG: hypothetical protein WB565_08935 [Acidimicrobiales bacterium]
MVSNLGAEHGLGDARRLQPSDPDSSEDQRQLYAITKGHGNRDVTVTDSASLDGIPLSITASARLYVT